jgi:Fic-DOC domain mobile mystery protein B
MECKMKFRYPLGSTPLELEEIAQLIPTHITTQEELNAWEEKNIGINWLHIPVKIKDLCDDVLYQLDHESYSKDEIAIRFHHRLVWIHAFPNGNGRHARLMADLLITQQGGIRFSWGMHQDLYKTNPVRQQYIEALQLADRGDYSKLLAFARS